MEICKVNTVTLPSIQDVTYSLGNQAEQFTFDEFLSPEGDECDLKWSYTSLLRNETALPEEMISFHPHNRTFIISANLKTIEQTLDISLIGELSDGKTTKTAKFKANYLRPPYLIDNTPPFLEDYRPFIEAYFENAI